MHVESTPIARVRGFELSPAAFRRIALASLAALLLIMTTGAAVRLTSSGLGCRHWPGCEAGHPLPAKDYHAFIEFGNRLVGGVTIFVTLALALAASRTPVLVRWQRRLALATFVGTLAQAPLGLLAVKTDLRWPVVMAHLLLSALLVAAAVVLVLETHRLVVGGVSPLVPLELRRVGVVLASSCFLLLVSGTLATAGGPHSGGGKDIRRLWRLEPLVYTHGAVVAVFGCTMLLTVGYLAAQRTRSPRLFGFAALTTVLLVGQMALGEAQYRTHLPWGLVLVHVALASVVWAATVALATLFWRPFSTLVPRT